MLTTRCPHCSTVFRIRPEQLSVRGGRVRCGHCQQPFSALSHLEDLDDDAGAHTQATSRPQAAAPAAPPTPVRQSEPPAPRPAPAPVFPQTVDPRPEPVVSSMPVPVVHTKPWPVPDADIDLPAPAFSDGAARQPLIQPDPPQTHAEAPAVGDDFSMSIRLDGPSPAQVRAEANEAGELDFDFTEIDEPTPAPVQAPAPAEPPAPYESKIARELGIPPYDPSQEQVFSQTVMLEEPIEIAGLPDPELDVGPHSLFDERERQQRMVSQVEDRRSSPVDYLLWGLGLFLLCVLAAMQLAYVFRTELTRWWPESRPLLEEACIMLDCDVPYPKVIDDGSKDGLITIEGSSFTPDSTQEGRFRLIASILNKAAFDQSWPHVEVTITDRFDIAIARRVLAPAEWLPPTYAQLKAFEAHSEVTASLGLDLGKLPASGYRLYVFYP